MQIIPNIGLAQFKLHPTRNAQQSDITNILSHNKTVFFTVTPDRMKQLLEAEQKLKELQQ